MNQMLKDELKNAGNCALRMVKIIVYAILCGIVVGLVSSAFAALMNLATSTRLAHFPLILFLPAAGALVVFVYHLFKNENDTGTNLVISALQSKDEVPLRMAPSIFLGTIITHLFGGSAGREGAALQLGGSIGSSLGHFLKLDEKDTHIIMMCGMSAAFSALFGTPMAASIFSMEVISVGIMHYSALVPCVLSSLVGYGIATYLGLSEHVFGISDIPGFTIWTGGIVVILAVLCALVSGLLCISLHTSTALYKKYIKNPYLRAVAGGAIVALLTFLVGSQDYNGTGLHIIVKALSGTVFPAAFLLKILFTSLTLGAGFKGGEIVPTFFVGATFGCMFGNLIGFSPSLCAAVGMVSVFCGVTNCPISSLLISFEMFGYEGMPFYLLACAFSYALSGYFSLYHSQIIVYSKTHTTFINRKTR